jgi:hypothetical protein
MNGNISDLKDFAESYDGLSRPNPSPWRGLMLLNFGRVLQEGYGARRGAFDKSDFNRGRPI